MTDTETMTQTAFAHLDAGRFEEAAKDFEKALEARPDDANLWYNLAYTQRRLGHAQAALDSYDRALDIGVAEPEQVLLNQSVIFANELKQPDKAEQGLEAALQLNPRYFPALLNLGGLMEDRGDREAARRAYERALEIAPNDPLVLSRVIVLTDDIDSVDHPLIARVKELFNRRDLTAGDHADLAFALGQVLDRIGEYENALEVYEHANRASSAVNAERQRAYDPVAETAATNRLIETFDGQAAATGEGGENLVFIVGMFRSGSTLVEQVLARHSRVTAGGELSAVPNVLAAAFQPYPASVPQASPEAMDEVRAAYLGELERLFPGHDVLTDKRPANFRHVGLIKTLFPRARFIDTLRHPVDNALSVWFAHLGPAAPYATEFRHIVHWRSEYRRLMEHWRSLYPDAIHEVGYDALVAEPEPHIRKLLDFCGLDFEEACLAPHKGDTQVRTLSAWQVRQPLYTTSSGRWRNYEKYIGTLLEAYPQG